MLFDKLFTKLERSHFDNCCYSFEIALSYFGYGAQVQFFVNDKRIISLYMVNIFYNDQKQQAFTALTLKELYKKMELYMSFIYMQKNLVALWMKLYHFLTIDQSFSAIQIEIDNLLNWHDLVDEESYRISSRSTIINVKTPTLH